MDHIHFSQKKNQYSNQKISIVFVILVLLTSTIIQIVNIVDTDVSLMVGIFVQGIVIFLLWHGYSMYQSYEDENTEICKSLKKTVITDYKNILWLTIMQLIMLCLILIVIYQTTYGVKYMLILTVIIDILLIIYLGVIYRRVTKLAHFIETYSKIYDLTDSHNTRLPVEDEVELKI